MLPNEHKCEHERAGSGVVSAKHKCVDMWAHVPLRHVVTVFEMIIDEYIEEYESPFSADTIHRRIDRIANWVKSIFIIFNLI